MKKVSAAIGFVTSFLVFYQLTPYLGISPDMIIIMFIASPFLVIGMVYMVLKYGEPSKYTFDERFYDDLDYRRNGTEEMKNRISLNQS